MGVSGAMNLGSSRRGEEAPIRHGVFEVRSEALAVELHSLTLRAVTQAEQRRRGGHQMSRNPSGGPMSREGS